MRPASIRWFERVYLGTLVVGLLNLLVHYNTIRVNLGTSSGQMGFIFISFMAGILISLLFWFLIARRASNLAKWFLVGLTVIGLLGLPGSFEMADTLGAAYIGIGVLCTVLQALAIGLLFTAESRRWFANKGVSAGPDVFE